MGRVRAALLVLLVGAAPGSSAAADWLDGDLHTEFDASLRTLYTQTRRLGAERLLVGESTSRANTALWLTRLRLDLEASWRDRVTARIVYDNEGYFGPGLDSLFFRLAGEIGGSTWADLDHVISDHRDGYWQHLVYRAWVRFQGDRYELTLGRQRIALGRTIIWNPTDLFNPIQPLQVQGDQRIGQDAAVLRVRLARDVWGVAIWSPQSDPDEHRSALRLEYSSVALDGAVMVAEIEEDWVFGMDLAGDVAGAGVRAEATYTDPDEQHGHIWQVVASADYTFGVGTGLYGLVEYFYNENRFDPIDIGRVVRLLGPYQTVDQGLKVLAAAGDAVIPAARRFPSIVRNRTGVSLGYDLTSLIRGSLLWLQDWDEGSAALVPSLGWSPNDHLEVSLGTQIFLGSGRDSEYGEATSLLFVQLDFYF